MNLCKYILIAVFVTQTGYSKGIDFTVSIEGESEIPSSTGGDYTAVVKRASNKKVIDSPNFKYEWTFQSSENMAEFNIAAPNLKTTGLTLKGGDRIYSAVCGKISCKVTYDDVFFTGARSIRITIK